MKMNGNTILITGGATGIGYSMAKYFCGHGNTVIICGRRKNKLAQAKKELPQIHTIQCDVTNPDDRTLLFNNISNNYPSMNILINNAGVQRSIDLSNGLDALSGGENEIRINLEAPIFLSALFTAFLSGKENAAIVNVTSGLAFMLEQAAWCPVYSATKAGLHAFSITQRAQLAPLGIRIIELIPPMVESELNPESRKGVTRENTPYMITSDDYAEKALAKMEQDIDEIKL